MERRIITIGRDGTVTVPVNVQMTDFEIAELFGVFCAKTKANIRSLLKSGICQGDYSNGGVVIGKTFYPQYYGLEMIIALSFRIDSANARIFRKWVLKQIVTNNREQTMFLYLPKSHINN